MLGGRSDWMGKGRLGEGPQEKVKLGGEPQEKLAWVWTTSHPYPHPTKVDKWKQLRTRLLGLGGFGWEKEDLSRAE